MKQKKPPAHSESESEEAASSSGEESEIEDVPENGLGPVKTARKRNKLIKMNKKLLTDIYVDYDPTDTRPFLEAIKTIDLSDYADDEEQLRNSLMRTCRTTLKLITLKEMMKVALSHMPFPKKRILNGFNVFCREFHKTHKEIPMKERMKLVGDAYKELDDDDKRRYGNTAAAELLEPLNGDTAKSPKPSKSPKVKAVPGTPNLKQFFEVVASPKPLKMDSPKKKTLTSESELKPTPKAAKKEKVTKQSKLDDETDGDLQFVPVNVFEYYAEERKLKKGESLGEAKKSYASLPKEEKIEYIYKIMQLIKKKFNKPPKLSKPDQDLLNEYEERPQHPGTAYSLFVTSKKADPSLAALTFGERSAMISTMWKNIDSDEKKMFEAHFAKKKAVYDANFNLYLENLPDFRREQEEPKSRNSKKVRARRASVSEVVDSPPEDQDEFVVLENVNGAPKVVAPPAKRRNRAKTIDCSSRVLDMNDFLVTKLAESEETPVKAGNKRKAVQLMEMETEVAAPSSPSSPKKLKKKKQQLEEEETAIRSPAPVREVTPPPPIPPAKEPEQNKSPKKAKTVEKEKKPRKKKVKLTEPVKPPDSAKALFKSTYEGDASKAGKAFKKLPLEEKQKYAEKVAVLGAKYMTDLQEYMQSLSKSEMEQFMLRHNADQ